MELVSASPAYIHKPLISSDEKYEDLVKMYHCDVHMNIYFNLVFCLNVINQSRIFVSRGIAPTLRITD